MSSKSTILVILQFASFIFFAIDGFANLSSLWVIPQVLAFGLAIWGILAMRIGNFNVQPEVKQTAVFVNNGPYKIIRNPMYTGIIIFFIISVIVQFSYLRIAVLLLLCFALIMKILMEESFLEKRFGEVYLVYKESTYRLFPFLF